MPDRRNAIFRRQVAQQFADHKHLAGEDQRAERQFAHQLSRHLPADSLQKSHSQSL
jgi:hypothetical protein